MTEVNQFETEILEDAEQQKKTILIGAEEEAKKILEKWM